MEKTWEKVGKGFGNLFLEFQRDFDNFSIFIEYFCKISCKKKNVYIRTGLRQRPWGKPFTYPKSYNWGKISNI